MTTTSGGKITVVVFVTVCPEVVDPGLKVKDPLAFFDLLLLPFLDVLEDNSEINLDEISSGTKE